MEMTSFINRQAEVDRARSLVRSSRPLTLTGAGGVGKTRLALRVARGMGRSFPDGMWFVDLAPLRNPALLAHTVAQTLELADQAAHDPVDVLVSYLRPRRLLLVLDNCERVRCRSISEERGDIWALSWALWTLALVEWSRGRPGLAAEYARQCLRIKHVFHDALGVACALDMLAWTAAAEGGRRPRHGAAGCRPDHLADHRGTPGRRSRAGRLARGERGRRPAGAGGQGVRRGVQARHGL
ncbi:hypothetical protein GTS_39640 [Gandjariella thermophila]|uniref:NB-ARC domain-containing protein n=1 Tax=Gandjariella thermophila TaxID=1931992 RepID=A0A4D4J6U1_9PSEU|nr:hypothetical protein GTS_39640 [Gandjariella thermophila]